MELIDKDQEQHAKRDQMVLEIKSTSSNSSEFKLKVGELQKFMLNHLDEEENELFPKVGECLDDEKLEKLATQLKETKSSLVEKVVD